MELQDGVVRRHIAQWLAQGPGELEIRPFIRCAAGERLCRLPSSNVASQDPMQSGLVSALPAPSSIMHGVWVGLEHDAFKS